MGFWGTLGKTALGAGIGFATGGPAGAVIGGGTALGGSLNKPKTQMNTLDPQMQAYIDQMRRQSQQASQLAIGGPQGGGSWFTGPQSMTIEQQVQPFMDPYQKQVVGGVQQIYDRNRAQAMNQTSQQATLGGAYGGSRAAVLAGSRLGEQDVGQANTIAGLLSSGYQNSLNQALPYWDQQRQLTQQQQMEPLWRQQQAQQFSNLGMGPYAFNQQQQGGGVGDWMQNAAGLASIYKGAGGQFKNPFGLFGGGQQPTSQWGLTQSVPMRQFPMPQPEQMTQIGQGIWR